MEFEFDLNFRHYLKEILISIESKMSKYDLSIYHDIKLALMILNDFREE